MHKIRIPQSKSFVLLLIFLFNMSVSPLSLSVPDSNLQNQDDTLDPISDQTPRFEYDVAANANPRGFSKAMANGIPTLTGWWDTDFDFRRMVNVTEPGTLARSQEPVTLNVDFTADTAYNDSLRIAYYNATSSNWVEVDSQVWQNSTHQGGSDEFYDEATITFFVDSTVGQAQTYYLYYDDNNQGLPSGYTDNINATAVDSVTAFNDTIMPSVTLPNGTSLSGRDMIYVNTTDSNGVAAAILLTDYLRAASDWGGPVNSLVRATYGSTDTLDTNYGQSADQFMLLGDLAIDPEGVSTDMTSSDTTRANLAPDNAGESWAPGSGIWITDDGPLFTRIKIVTSDGGYADHTYWNQNSSDDTMSPSRSNGGSGFVNYTFEYTFFYHGDNLLANLAIDLEANEQYQDTDVAVHFKNYGDWPHMVSLTSAGTDGTVDSIQGQKAWDGVLRGLFNESSDGRRHDFPVEPWVAWYDNGTSGAGDVPGIGVVAKTNPTGWEVYSLAVTGMGDNLVLQQIVREGHQGDFFVLENGQHLIYDYYIYTSAYGQNFTEIRDLSFKVNNPLEISIGEEELYAHNVLTIFSGDIDGSSISDVSIDLWNSSSVLVKSGITNTSGYIVFTKVEDDTYEIRANYTIGAGGGSKEYEVNVTAGFSIDHTSERAWSVDLNCTVVRLNVTAQDWSDASPLSPATIRLINSSDTGIYVDNTTVADGSTRFILLNGTTYNITVFYPTGQTVDDITPTQIIIAGSRLGSPLTIDCAVLTHSTELNPFYPISAFASVDPDETVEFSVRYMDTTEVPDVPIVNVTVGTWTLWNVTDDVQVSTGAVEVAGNGYYNHSVDISTLDTTKAYTLSFSLDNDTPIDYSPASFVYSISINSINTDLTIYNQAGTTEISSAEITVGQTYNVTLNYNDTRSAPELGITGATVSNVTNPISGITMAAAYELGGGNYTVELTSDTPGTYTVTFTTEKTTYQNASGFLTLTVVPLQTALAIYNQAGTAEISSAAITIGETYTVTLNYNDTYNAPELGITGATISNVTSPMTNITVAAASDVGGGNYTVGFVTNATGTYSITFTASKPDYQNASKFLILTVVPLQTNLTITSPGETWQGDVDQEIEITLHFQDENGINLNSTIHGANITVASIDADISIIEGPLEIDPIGQSGDWNITLKATTQGAFRVSFKAICTGTNYTDTFAFFTLATGATPAHLIITNPGSPSQASIEVGQSYTLYLRYEVTSAPYTNISVPSNSSGWDIDVTPGTGLSLGPPYPTESSPGSGNYSIVLTPTATGTYTIIFSTMNSTYTDGVAFFTLLMGDIQSTLSVVDSDDEVFEGEDADFTLLYTSSVYGGISGANIALNIDPDADWGWSDSGGGYYTVTVSPDDDDTYTLRFTASRATYTTGRDATTLNVILRPTRIDIDSNNPDTEFVGETYTIELTYERTDKDKKIGDADIDVDEIIPKTGIKVKDIDEISNGEYEIELELNAAGTFTIVIVAEKGGREDASTSVILTVKLRPTELVINSPSTAEIFAEDTYPLKVKYNDTSSGTGIEGGSVMVAVTPSTGVMAEPGVELGNGSYLIALRGDTIGTYTVTVTVSRSLYQVAAVNFFLTVESIPTSLEILELHGTNLTTSIARPINESVTVVLSFTRALDDNPPVDNATVRILGVEEWQILESFENGTYIAEVNTGNVLGIYPIMVIASKENYEIGRESFELQIRPYTTELLLWGGTQASAAIPVNETLELEVYYNNTDWGLPVSDAELVISGFPLTNNRDITWQQTEADSYIVSIATGTLIETNVFTLVITGRSPPAYEAAMLFFELEITSIPFRAQNQFPTIPGEDPTLSQSISTEQDQDANVNIQLWDIYHELPIDGADVSWILYVDNTPEQGILKASTGYTSSMIRLVQEEWARGEFTYIGNGTYIADVSTDNLEPGTYSLEIVSSKELYAEQTFTMDIVVTLKPGTPTYYFLGLASIILGSLGGFYAWFFYFRYPPQVRYIRKALKRIDAGSQISEGRFLNKEDLHKTMVKEQLELPRQLMD